MTTTPTAESIAHEERAIRLAAKMYETRDGLRGLLGPEKYAEEMAICKPVLAGYAKEHNLSHAAAVLAIAKEKPELELAPMLTAALVEIAEGG